MALEFKQTIETDFAMHAEQKFRFYFLSLIFTLLALSVQTAEFGRSILEDILELGGWVALLTSGLVALSTLEWDVVLRLQHVRKDELEQSRSQLRQAAAAGLAIIHVEKEGKDKPVEERLQDYDDALTSMEPVISKLETWGQLKYDIAKYSFVAGLVWMIGSRSAGAIAGLLGERLL